MSGKVKRARGHDVNTYYSVVLDWFLLHYNDLIYNSLWGTIASYHGDEVDDFRR
jgi:hypothetical protein